MAAPGQKLISEAGLRVWFRTKCCSFGWGYCLRHFVVLPLEVEMKPENCTSLAQNHVKWINCQWYLNVKIVFVRLTDLSLLGTIHFACEGHCHSAHSLAAQVLSLVPSERVETSYFNYSLRVGCFSGGTNQVWFQADDSSIYIRMHTHIFWNHFVIMVKNMAVHWPNNVLVGSCLTKCFPSGAFECL